MSKKRVVFIWPPSISKPSILYPNLSIAYLSRILKVNNFDVTNVDLNIVVYQFMKEKSLPDNKIAFYKLLKKTIEIVEKTNPDILCIGNWFENFPFSIEFVRDFKARNKDCIVIMGGYPATFTPDEVFGITPDIDFLVKGEGEYALLELCKVLDRKGESFDKINGICYRNKEGKIVHTPDRPLIKNLDELPLIDFEDFIYFNSVKHKLFNIITTRGCPYSKCSFCSIYGMFNCYRIHSNKYVINQTKHLINLYDPEEICINDDDFLTNTNRLKQLSRLLINNNFNIKFSCGGRGDELSKESLDTLEKAGFIHITVGVENIIPKVLKFYNKAPDVYGYIKKVKKGIEISKNFDIKIAASFIIGSPVETREDMMKNVEFMKSVSKNICRFDVSRLILLPGSFLWKKYLNGDILIFKRREKNTFIEELYSHLPWIVPQAYIVKNNYHPNEEFETIIKEVSNTIDLISSKS